LREHHGGRQGAALLERLAASRVAAEANAQRLEDVRARLDATQRQIRAPCEKRDLLHESAFARLQARLESMPVIEQAKGILMAEAGCGPDEAFDMLRRASQRMNVPVRDLAADIVQRTTARGPGRPATGSLRVKHRGARPGARHA
jgi:hypothetical protein